MALVQPTDALLVQIDGRELPPELSAQLARIDVAQSIYRASRAILTLHDEDYSVLDQLSIGVGAAVHVRFAASTAASSTVFDGHVTAIGLDHPDGAGPQVRIEAEDQTGRLYATTTWIGHLRKKYSDIVSAIAEAHGLQADVTTSARALEHLLQATSDGDLLDRMAARDGVGWFVDDGTLRYRPRPTSATASVKRSDGSLIRFSARFETASLPTELTVAGWEPGQQAHVTETTKIGSGALGTTAKLFADGVSKAAERATHRRVGTAVVDDQDEATAFAAALAEQAVRAGVRVEGLAWGDPAIRAGSVLEVAEVGSSLSGDYYLTDVTHTYGEGQPVQTRFESLPPPAGGGGRADHDRFGELGLVVAKVTNVDDDERLGRVKVTFPSLGSDNESAWARVLSIGAGANRGFDIRPEVDDEVLVGFEQGDPRHPYVLGGLFSEAIKPSSLLGSDERTKIAASTDKGWPAADSVIDGGKVSRREFVSRAGHRLTFHDGGVGFVRLALNDGKAFLTMSTESTELSAVKGTPLVIKAGDASITLADDGQITIKGKGVVIDAGDKPVQAKGMKVELKAQNGGTFDAGNGPFEAKGLQAKVEGQTQAELKGMIVKIN